MDELPERMVGEEKDLDLIYHRGRVLTTTLVRALKR
jgi:hypothetical protein